VIRFSPWGYLGFTIWGLILALTLEGWRLAVLVALELLFGIAWSQAGLRPLRRVQFWLFIASALALGPLVARGEGPMADGAGPMWAAPLGVGSVAILVTALRPGLAMAGRALALTLAFSLGLSALSMSDVIALFDRLGLSGLGFAFGVAMNLFNTLQEMARVTFETLSSAAGSGGLFWHSVCSWSRSSATPCATATRLSMPPRFAPSIPMLRGARGPPRREGSSGPTWVSLLAWLCVASCSASPHPSAPLCHRLDYAYNSLPQESAVGKRRAVWRPNQRLIRASLVVARSKADGCRRPSRMWFTVAQEVLWPRLKGVARE